MFDRYTFSLILVLFLLPPLLAISIVALMKRDLSFVIGAVVFFAMLGVGKTVTQIFAPSSRSKSLAFLPVGQLTFVTTYLLFQNIVSLLVLTWLLVMLGIFSIALGVSTESIGLTAILLSLVALDKAVLNVE